MIEHSKRSDRARAVHEARHRSAGTSSPTSSSISTPRHRRPGTHQRRVRPARDRAGARLTARKAMYAVYAVFILNGFMFATWASRIPQVRDGLELNPQRLGLVLLAIAIGSLVSMPLAGARHLAPRRRAHRERHVLDRRERPGDRGDRLPVRRRSGHPRAVPARPGQRHLGRGDERRGRRGRAPPRQLDHVALPRGLQRRHRRRRAAGLADDRARRLRHRAPRRGGGADRGDRDPRPSAASCRRPPRRASRGRGAAQPAEGLDRAAHAADRRVRVLHGVHRGHRRGLARRRRHRRLWRRARAGLAHVRRLPDGDDARPLVRPRPAGPPRARAADPRDRRGRGARADAGRVRRLARGGDGGRRAVGRRRRARLPGRDERRRRRPRHAAGRVSVVSSIGYLAFLAGPPFVGFLGHEVGTLRALLAAAGLVSLGVLLSGVLRPRAPARVEACASY